MDAQGLELGLGRRGLSTCGGGVGAVGTQRVHYGQTVSGGTWLGSSISQPHQHATVRHYAKGGKQMKRKGASVVPQAPTNPSMKAAVDKHVSTPRSGG